MAALPLSEAMTMHPDLAGEIVVIRDLLNLGSIQKTEDGQKFSELRSAFWQTVTNGDKSIINVDDTERILKVSAAMAADHSHAAWLWVAPWSADICTLLWLAKYLGKYLGRFYTVSIAGLPFLDENGKVFYPRNISELQPKEVVKARKLARQVTLAEIESDAEEWTRLVMENGGIRFLEGNKKIISRNIDYYDTQLFSACSHQWQKASKVINLAMTKGNLPTGDIFLAWRLRQMANDEKIKLQGDASRTHRDFEVKIPEGTLQF